jgi:putative flippase GtrA
VNTAILLRLLKFLSVGAIGVVVQLGTLAAFRLTRMHYLAATVLAVECAILHNFIWHRRFTWADRTRSGARNFLLSLFRFHLSNGLISLAGNLLLMRVLVGGLRMPWLRANIEAIAACFVGNFLAGDRWVFRAPGRAEASKMQCS